MKNLSRHIGKLDIIGRLDSSYFGNPRYELRVNGIYCVTAVDSMLGYSVTNFDGKEVVATIGTHYNRPTINSIQPV
jgi:hypothetical protein